MKTSIQVSSFLFSGSQHFFFFNWKQSKIVSTVPQRCTFRPKCRLIFHKHGKCLKGLQEITAWSGTKKKKWRRHCGGNQISSHMLSSSAVWKYTLIIQLKRMVKEEKNAVLYLESLWCTEYKPATFNRDRPSLLFNVWSNVSAFFHLFWCHWILLNYWYEAVAFFLTVHAWCGLHSELRCSNRPEEHLGFPFFIVLSCVSTSTGVSSLIFSLKLPSYNSTIHTFCLPSCLSLIGWQLCGRRCCLIYWVHQVLVEHVCLESSKKVV